MRLIQMPGNLAKGYVRRRLDQRQDLPRVGFDPVRALISALPPWPNIARLSPAIDPFNRRRDRDPKAFRRRAPRHPGFNR
jgi:hypothetical protein